jgi:hypothetical protein
MAVNVWSSATEVKYPLNKILGVHLTLPEVETRVIQSIATALPGTLIYI